MAWLAVDLNGSEWVYGCKPKKMNTIWTNSVVDTMYLKLPNGSIEKLIGRKLTWEDEPVELGEIDG